MNETSIVSIVLPVLTDAAVKSATVLLLAWGATLALRQASAATRHVVWLAAIVVSLMLPIATAMLPTYRLTILPASTDAVEHNPAIIVNPVESWAWSSLPTAKSSHNDEIVPRPKTQLLPLVGPETPRPTSLVIPSHTPKIVFPATPRAAVARPGLLVTVWCIGSIGLISWRLLGLLAAWWLTRRGVTVASGRLFDALQSMRAELNVRQHVTLRVGTDQTMPLASGFLQPCVMLPAAADQWSAAQLRSVLLHEFAHVKRFDCFTQWLAQLNAAVYWFNPLAWLAAARLRSECERACDDLALSHGSDPSTYAEHLLSIARALRSRSLVPFGGVAMARRSGLRRRVVDILNQRTDRRPPPAVLKFAAPAIAAAILIPLAAVHLQGREVDDVPAKLPVIALPLPTPSPVVVIERPQLRFLSWQGGSKRPVGPLLRPWLLDGHVISPEQTKWLLELLPPLDEDVSAANLPPLDVLYLWFSHPAFDAQTYVNVDVTDPGGKSLLVPFGPIDTSTMSPDAVRQNLGWVMAAPCIATTGGRPVDATVRLSYSVGPWMDGPSFKSDYNGSIAFGNAVILSSFGQDKDGHAFVSIAYDADARDTQYGFTVHTRDGRDLPCDLKQTFGSAGFFTQRFSADVPFSAVESFTSRSRPVKSIAYRNVSLAAGHRTSMQVDSGEARAAEAVDPGPTLAAVPPVVVRTFPLAGSTDVDPTTNELTVTFSKPMADKSWSWVQTGADSFPELLGNTHYLTDHRTCVLPVKLKPDHAYTVWLNTDDFNNFVDNSHQPAVPYLLVFHTRPAAATQSSHT